MGPFSFLRVFLVTQMTQSNLLLQHANFLSPLLSSVVQHQLPPILVFLLWDSTLYSFFQRILINILEIQFRRFCAYNSMKLWALLELLRLFFPSKLGHGYVICVHIRVRNLCNELIIIFQELLDLLMDIREILKIKSFGWPLLSRRLSILVVGIAFL